MDVLLTTKINSSDFNGTSMSAGRASNAGSNKKTFEIRMRGTDEFKSKEIAEKFSSIDFFQQGNC